MCGNPEHFFLLLQHVCKSKILHMHYTGSARQWWLRSLVNFACCVSGGGGMRTGRSCHLILATGVNLFIVRDTVSSNSSNLVLGTGAQVLESIPVTRVVKIARFLRSINRH